MSKYWIKKEKKIIEEYFIDFNRALATYLRPYKGKLGYEWLKIDREILGVKIYFLDNAFVFKITSKSNSSGVEVFEGDKNNLEQAITSTWLPCKTTGNKVHFHVVAKPIKGSNFGISSDREKTNQIYFDIVADTSVMVIGPRLYNLISDKEVSKLETCRSDREIRALHLHIPIPPWIFHFQSGNTGLEVLNGLDEDPLLAAKGVADIILHIAGISDEKPSLKYNRARKELVDAIHENNDINETSIHSVIEKYPWIIVDECDYTEFRSEHTLKYTDTISYDQNNTPIQEEKSIRPDFIYKKYEDTLIVEIEAATKPILKKQKETGQNLPTAKNVATLFQIGNYKNIINTHKEIRRQLGVTDTHPIKYLLVVGSKKQKNFSLAAWENIKNSLPSEIAVRDWDYYLDRLERLEKASTFNN